MRSETAAGPTSHIDRYPSSPSLSTPPSWINTGAKPAVIWETSLFSRSERPSQTKSHPSRKPSGTHTPLHGRVELKTPAARSLQPQNQGWNKQHHLTIFEESRDVLAITHAAARNNVQCLPRCTSNCPPWSWKRIADACTSRTFS